MSSAGRPTNELRVERFARWMQLGGIHFQDGGEPGYNLGQQVGGNVLAQTMG